MVGDEEQPPQQPQPPRIPLRTLTGWCGGDAAGAKDASKNRTSASSTPTASSSMDWSERSGLIAMAWSSNSVVVVVDPVSLKVVQVLRDEHHNVSKLAWTRADCTSKMVADRMTLAAASPRSVAIWNVKSGQMKIRLVETHHPSGSHLPVNDIAWMDLDSCGHLLLALYHPNHLVMWDAASGSKLWKKTYGEAPSALLSVDLDPFDPTRLAFRTASSGSACVFLVQDFQMTSKTPPLGAGTKFYISRKSAHPQLGAAPAAAASNSAPRTAKAKIKNLVKELVTGGEGTPATTPTSANPGFFLSGFVDDGPLHHDVATTPTSPFLPSRLPSSASAQQLQNLLLLQDAAASSAPELLQVVFHKALRHQLLLVYPREVVVVDLEVAHAVGTVSLEKTAAPALLQVIPCGGHDALFLLHENGMVSLRTRKAQGSGGHGWGSHYFGAVPSAQPEVAYEQRALSEAVKLSKMGRVLGLALHPVTERNLALLTSDGRLVALDLHSRCSGRVLDEGAGLPRRPHLCLEDVVRGQQEAPGGNPLRLCASGIATGLAPPPFVIRMCPALTLKNLTEYRPLLALGAASGNLQIIDLVSGSVRREFAVHTFPVHGIEWTSLATLLSFAHPTNPTKMSSADSPTTGSAHSSGSVAAASAGSSANGSNVVRNELVHLDIRTGRTTALRSNRSEEAPIQMVRVSHLKQYFIVAFSGFGSPFELWDLRSLTLIRTMPKKFPPITALDWSPLHNLKHLKKLEREKQQQQLEKTSSSSSPQPDPSSAETVAAAPPKPANVPTAKEHFVFTDYNGELYHFSVEGNTIKDGTKISAESGLGLVTCIAWKSDIVVRGDSVGNLHVLDVKAKLSRMVQTGRGAVKKIRFAPGRGNMKLMVLHRHSVSLWEAKDLDLINELRSPKDMASRPLDVEWAASDRPVLATADGCLRVMSLALSGCSSPMSEYSESAIACHSFMPNRTRNNFHALLHHRPWSRKKDQDLFLRWLDLEKEDGFKDPAQLEFFRAQVSMMDRDLRTYLCSPKVATVDRCLAASQYCGLRWNADFWRVASRALWPRNSSQGHEEQHAPRPGDCFAAALSQRFDLAMDSADYADFQKAKLHFHESRVSAGGDVRKRLVSYRLCLDQRDEAVRMLLEGSSPDCPGYYEDLLTACLVSMAGVEGGDPPPAVNSTSKLVATNLIAEGRLWEGVQLLCLIGKVADACSYLQASGEWDASLWLAKCRLAADDPEAFAKVLGKYVDHHQPPDARRLKAVLILLVSGDFVGVLDQLLGAKMVPLAAQFLQVCEEARVLPDTSHVVVITEEIRLAYARYLFDCGNVPAAFHYCDQADEKGAVLRHEFEVLTSVTEETPAAIVGGDLAESR